MGKRGYHLEDPSTVRVGAEVSVTDSISMTDADHLGSTNNLGGQIQAPQLNSCHDA